MTCSDLLHMRLKFVLLIQSCDLRSASGGHSRHSDPQAARQAPLHLEERRLIFGREEAMTHQEIDEDSPAIGLELAGVHPLNHLGNPHELRQ